MSIAIHKTLSRLQLRLWSAVLLLAATQAAWAGVTVSWTAPANGTVYVTSPADIVLQASASATQGYTVSKVEFFNGPTLIGTDTTSPYSFNWNSVPPGTYVLTAKATATKANSSSQTATSAAATVTVNAPPAVSMTSPASANTDLSIPPPTVTLQAQASDSDGSIASVEFRSMPCSGAEFSIATLTTPPYTFDWTIPTPYYYSGDKPQCYFVNAVATDNRGAKTTSAWKHFSLNVTVELTSPANGANYTAPASIPLAVAISPPDYPISKVQYFNGTTLIGESTTPPYSLTWSGVPAGTYSLSAQIISGIGSHQFPSSAVNVTVNRATALYFIEVDHLDTPRLVADSAGTTVWRNDNSEPFGDAVADENPSGLGTFEFPLRFRGTYRDGETSDLYNYFRDLDVSLGRYRQSDPIGLQAGLNTYAHVLSNPLSLSDPRGLIVVCVPMLGRMVCIGGPDLGNNGAQPGGANPPSGGEVIPFPGGRDRPTERLDRPSGREDRNSCPAPDRDPLCPFTGLATFDSTGAYSYELSCQYRCPRKGLKYLKTTVYFASANPAFLCDPAVPEYYFP